MTTSEPRRITRLLIANRGEIARRIIRTCDELGIETVAVFSDPDRSAPYVDEATYAVALGGSTSAESYLDAAKVLDAARRSGVDAVHPGYGFLSENPDFASAVSDSGLVWVGPTPESMRAMALKVEAKRIAADAGVPLVPGAELAADLGEDELLSRGEQVGYPVLVKASAGGGGKGMRVVRSAADLAEAVAGARREAQASFSDPTVFLERYLERSRHVEVQVFGDEHGHVVHLFERECSIQRRHQKIVEESPSPGATPATLEAMYAAAVSLASAIGYVGAGTVEFLVSGEGEAQEFFFLEMNTRLQVEHPVTEMVTGLDLVAWQLAVAQGEPLPLAQNEIERSGHAIEVRLYAEDPARDFLPSTGTITGWELSEWDDEVRLDSAVHHGSVVSPYYDPMLAKVIAFADSRDEAADRLVRALRSAGITGILTNASSLVAVLLARAFRAGDTTTSFLDEHPETLRPHLDAALVRRHLAAAAVNVLDPTSTFVREAGPVRAWRNVAGAPELLALRYRDAGDERTALVAREWHRDGAVYWVCVDTGDEAFAPAQTIADDPRFEKLHGLRFDSQYHWRVGIDRDGRLELDGVRRKVSVRVDRDSARSRRGEVWLEVEEPVLGVLVSDAEGSTYFAAVEAWAGSGHDGSGGGPTTPVPGTVTHVAVAVGDVVEAGQALVVLEAMKMEHTIRADADGTVTELHVSVGQSVDAHTVVATVEASS